MKRRYEWTLFSFFEDGAVTAHFEKMARRGWQIEKTSPYLWRYRREEPRKTRFSAAYFAETSDFNPGPTENEETLRDYCAEAGWEYVTNWSKMLIFRTERTDAVPLETEGATKLAATHTAMKRLLLAYLILLAIAVWLTAYQLTSDFVNCVSSPGQLAGLGLMGLSAAAILLELGRYVRWYLKSKASIARGGGCLERSSLWGRAVNGLLWASMAAFFLVYFPSLFRQSRGMAAIMVLLLGVLLLEQGILRGIRALLKRRGLDGKVNMVITMGVTFVVTFGLLMVVIYKGAEAVADGWLAEPGEESYVTDYGSTVELRRDVLALSPEALGLEMGPGRSAEAEAQSTPLLAYRTGQWRDYTGGPGFYYRVLDVRAEFLYEPCLRDWTRRQTYHGNLTLWDFRGADPAPWGAEAAYQRIWNNGDGKETANDIYVLCRDGRIVYLDFGWTPTPEQMALAAQTLFAYEFE